MGPAFRIDIAERYIELLHPLLYDMIYESRDMTLVPIGLPTQGQLQIGLKMTTKCCLTLYQQMGDLTALVLSVRP